MHLKQEHSAALEAELQFYVQNKQIKFFLPHNLD